MHSRHYPSPQVRHPSRTPSAKEAHGVIQSFPRRQRCSEEKERGRGDPPVGEDHADAEAECAEHQQPPSGGGPPVHRPAFALHRLPSATLRILSSDGGTSLNSSRQSSAPEAGAAQQRRAPSRGFRPNTHGDFRARPRPKQTSRAAVTEVVSRTSGEEEAGRLKLCRLQWSA